MIESTQNKLNYVVGESAVFPFNLRFFRPEDIKCFLNQDNVQTELVRNVDFSVERKENYDSGANVTLLLNELPTGATLSILRICDITQDLALPENGKLPSSGLERQLDKLTMIAQQQAEELSRCIKNDVTNPGTGSLDAGTLKMPGDVKYYANMPVAAALQQIGGVLDELDNALEDI